MKDIFQLSYISGNAEPLFEMISYIWLSFASVAENNSYLSWNVVWGDLFRRSEHRCPESREFGSGARNQKGVTLARRSLCEEASRGAAALGARCDAAARPATPLCAPLDKEFHYRPPLGAMWMCPEDSILAHLHPNRMLCFIHT